MELASNVLSKGKRLLINAAVRLSAETRNLNSLSLRELAREAGLNPNTFYRHFKNLDELGLAIIEEIARHLRQPLRNLRKTAAESAIDQPLEAIDWQQAPMLSMQMSTAVNQATVRLFFEYVEENADVIILGVRELHGGSPVLRSAIRLMMAGFAQDMAEDIQALRLMPPLPNEVLHGVAESVTREMFQLAMEYIEQPKQQAEILVKAETFISALFLGTAVQHGYSGLFHQILTSESEADESGN